MSSKALEIKKGKGLGSEGLGCLGPSLGYSQPHRAHRLKERHPGPETHLTSSTLSKKIQRMLPVTAPRAPLGKLLFALAEA